MIKKVIFILFFLVVFKSGFSQDENSFWNIENLRIKTNLSQIVLFNEYSAIGEYNMWNIASVELKLGYKLNSKKFDNEKEYDYDNLEYTSLYRDHSGPLIQLGMKVFNRYDIFSPRNSFWGFNFNYSRKYYENNCILYKTDENGKNRRELIRENINQFNFKMILGQESYLDFMIYEWYAGLGITYQQVDRFTISAGYSGSYKDVNINQWSKDERLYPSLHFGINIGFNFDETPKPAAF